MPAAGFVRQVLEQSVRWPSRAYATRAAVVGGYPAGGLRYKARP